MIYLALKFESGEKAGIKEIADFIEASEHTVGKMLQSLVKENVINSAKGPNDGFYEQQNKDLNPSSILLMRSMEKKFLINAG